MICRAGRETRTPFARSSCGWHFFYESPQPVARSAAWAAQNLATQDRRSRGGRLGALRGALTRIPSVHVHQPR